jgi:prolyl oligopeptidase
MLPSVATRRTQAGSDHFGVRVEDPYRWLEQGNDPEVVAWVREQNARTDAYLQKIPQRAALRERIAALSAVERRSAPRVCQLGGGRQRCFFTRRDGSRVQPVLCYRDDDGPERVLLDVASGASGNTAIDWFYPSRDGTLVAYGTSTGGSEESTLCVLRVDGTTVTEKIPGTAHASLAWFHDGSGFYYSRHPIRGSVPEGEERLHRAIYAHHLGRPWQEDELFYRGAVNDYPSVTLSPNGEWLVLRVHRGWHENAVFVRRRGTRQWLPFATEPGLIFDVVPTDECLYVRTNRDAPRFAIHRAPWPDARSGTDWHEVVPESGETLNAFAVTRGPGLVASYLSDAAARLRWFDVTSGRAEDIELPTLGSIAGLSAAPDSPDAFVEFTSFGRPSEVLRYSTRENRTSLWSSNAASASQSDYEVSRLRAPAADGTPIPMFLVRRREQARRPGPSPTLLIGYGAFNISLSPKFEPASCAFLEQGGTLCVANLRGGGEFGREWYEAGLRANKPTVFGDAAACAAFLIREGLTTPEQLGFLGESHAGLVGGVLLTQHRELFRAIVCSVPLSDMVRFELFGAGRLFADEYGTVSDEREFRCLHGYSPYHRAATRAVYPAAMITCGERDARVDPCHARKLAAAMQHAQLGPAPVLLRSDADTGHGIGKPLDRYVDSMAEIYAFLFNELGVPWPE